MGETVPNLTASGTNIKWYDDAALTNQVFSGSSFATGETATGTYTFYATQTDVNSCESLADTVILTINAIPLAPVANDTTVCEGTSIPDLTASGTNVKWYDDATLTNLVFSGSSFATGETQAGTYTFYVTQTDANSCESPADTVILTIDAIPLAPVANDTAVCEGASIPDLTASGTNIQWYDSPTLLTPVFSGSSFATGETAAGTYTFYATQTLNSCESLADTVILTINAIPNMPIASDTGICFGSSTPKLNCFWLKYSMV